MLSRFNRYYHTLKHLKWIQVKYQLWYRLNHNLSIGQAGKIFTGEVKNNNTVFTKNNLRLVESIPSRVSHLGKNKFQFLNIQHEFKNGIDWNFNQHGKLWTYNLNYFEFLGQPNFSKAEGLRLIQDFIQKQKVSKDGMESFPISLRIIFWIKFLVKNEIADKEINRSLYAQLQRLSARPEYHLLGNHLLENGFSLLFGSFYFEDKKIFAQAKEIITIQLQEQILPDGAHFELSPMYHQIMLFRILDCINLLQNNDWERDSAFLVFLKKQASKMLGWLNAFSFSDTHLAQLNDSTLHISPEFIDLTKYARRLKVSAEEVILKECGYRKYSNSHYECLVDVGRIGPSYIPGHAHSDTFNFVLQHRNQPLIVDTGISTYEKNTRRTLERSTCSHNTVMIAGQEQSEIWGGFRVARRANIIFLEEEKNRIRAAHDGYKKLGCTHEREFIFGEKLFQILDTIKGKKEGIAFLHFHPTVIFRVEGNKILGENWRIEFENSTSIELKDYFFAAGFNRTLPAKKVSVHFYNKLITNITFL